MKRSALCGQIAQVYNHSPYKFIAPTISNNKAQKAQNLNNQPAMQTLKLSEPNMTL